MLDTLVHGIDRGMRSLSETFFGPVGSYCKLETVDQDALVADDGSLISVLRLEGALKQVGVEEYRTITRSLTEKLQSTLSRPGHVIQLVFEYDPEASDARIREMLRPSRRTAQNLGLNIGPCWKIGDRLCNATVQWKHAGWSCGHGPPCCRIHCAKPRSRRGSRQWAKLPCSRVASRWPQGSPPCMMPTTVLSPAFWTPFVKRNCWSTRSRRTKRCGTSASVLTRTSRIVTGRRVFRAIRCLCACRSGHSVFGTAAQRHLPGFQDAALAA